MKTMMNIGTLELRTIYQRYMTEGLVIAGLFHFAVLGSFQMYSTFFDAEIVKFPKKPDDGIIIDHLRVWFNRPQPIPNVSITKPLQPDVGIPIPIPDLEINPEKTIATQTQMNETIGTEIGVEGGTGTIISEGTTIGNEEVPPEPFVVVEKLPVPITHPAPSFPEIARRAGVEGTVFIKMWVTKEGKVKTVEVLKSTSNIFDQAAIDAAMLWTFTPAIMNNGPVSVWVTVPFKFRLSSKQIY